MHLTKMHGLGNDYLYYYGELENPDKVSRKLSDRHFGIGSDGVITISPSSVSDFRMRIFNADGSEALMCGNGIRCVGKYVFEKGYTDKTVLTIETLSGIKTLTLHTCNGKVPSVTVDMGKCTVKESAKLEIGQSKVRFTSVSVGNNHAVIFVPNADAASVETIGKAFEHHPHFPDGVNTEFAEIQDEHTVRMRVWERGSGITMACGTGACASVAAAVNAGFFCVRSDITVKLDGGELKVRILDDGTAVMTGPAETVCECEVG